MDIVKFQDISMTPEILMGLSDSNWYKVENIGTEEAPIYDWTHKKEDPGYGRNPQEFCTFFNNLLRNRYAYALRWNVIMPMNESKSKRIEDPDNPDSQIEVAGELRPVGDPFNIDPTEKSYVNAENGKFVPVELWRFDDMKDWMDQVTTLNILQNNRTKYDYLNKFTPDNDITIEELKRFRSWLAGILLANTPMIESWNNPEMITAMLTYYKQNMTDSTTDALLEFGRYMTPNVLVASGGLQSVFNMAMIGRSAGCGCYNSLQGVGTVAATGGCDPVQMYRNAIYNYMVETFSTLDYWTEQVEICVEMRKYIEGILKVGLPLGSKIIDPYADCGCNTFDSDSQTRYRKMLEALVQALTYIIDGTITGNRNYIITAFSNWATYLYEYMYWA